MTPELKREKQLQKKTKVCLRKVQSELRSERIE